MCVGSVPALIECDQAHVVPDFALFKSALNLSDRSSQNILTVFCHNIRALLAPIKLYQLHTGVHNEGRVVVLDVLLLLS